MSDKLTRPYFTKEKAEILRKTLGQFDEEITVDPLALDEKDFSSLRKDCTFLLHVLIEILCGVFEEDEYKRQKLYDSLCKDFDGNAFIDSVRGAEKLTRMRRDTALKVYEHIKRVHQSISLLPNELAYEVQETSVPISTLEKYNEAFDQLSIIARGGFGTVYKARHKVDGSIYAVKKIIFVYRNDSDYVKVMREVRNLSSLSNKYVVAYNNAWVQPVCQQDLNSEELDSESDYTEDQCTDNMSIFDQSMDYSNSSFRTYSYNAHRVSNCSESSSIVFQNDPNDSQSILNTNENEKFYSRSLKTLDSHFESPDVPILRIKMVLCIQMEFCDFDLRHWLEARNGGDPLPFSKSIPDIFKEILCGVAYIHEREIIHRDLKPQNIFFSKARGVMKVGDFGLATLSPSPSEEEQGSSNHSTNLGTLPYAAPEQRSNSVYDSKVDMYSLGIILIELLVQVGTKMEFFKVIDDFKKGIVPEEIELRWPEYIPLLKNLLQEENSNRYNSKEVLDMPLFKDKQIEGGDLEQKVKDLERDLANKEKDFQERENALMQKLQERENALMQKLQERENALMQKLQEQEQKFQEQEQKFQEQEQKFQEQMRAIEDEKEKISKEVKLLQECVNCL